MDMEERCALHRSNFKETLDEIKGVQRDHEKRIEVQEQYRVGTEQQLKNLVERIDGLITAIKWGGGFLVGGFVSFFFYAVQQGIFR